MENSNGNYPVYKIALRGPHQSLQNNFMWDNIAKFSVVIGVNGVGKTHLLQAISRAIEADYGAI
jgi:ABC-type branched-subunit amino acid transport system ATPase component